MKRAFSLLLTGAVLATAAGLADAGEYARCNLSTQDCLNELATRLGNYGWTGLDGEYDAGTGVYTVSKLLEGSPAIGAGFQPGDELYGINGVKFAAMTEVDWQKLAAVRVPGAVVTYSVHRGGTSLDIEVTLAPMPKDIIAKEIGKHMLEHVDVAKVP